MTIVVDGSLSNENIRELQEAVRALQEAAEGGGGGGSGSEITNASIISGTVTVEASRVYVRDGEVHPADGSNYLYSGHIQWQTGNVTGNDPGVRANIGSNHFQIQGGDTTLTGDLSGVANIGNTDARFRAGNVTISGSTGFAGTVTSSDADLRAGTVIFANGEGADGGRVFMFGATENGGGDTVISGGADGRSSGSQGGDLVLSGGGASSGTPGNILLSNLPTSDPGVAGALWNDIGAVKISDGP